MELNMFREMYLASSILIGTLPPISLLKSGQVTNGILRWPPYDSTKPSSFRRPYHSSTFPEKTAKPNTSYRPNAYEIRCKSGSNSFWRNFCIRVMRKRVKLVDASADVV